jgi:flagellar hook-length control protein FliK
MRQEIGFGLSNALRPFAGTASRERMSAPNASGVVDENGRRESFRLPDAPAQPIKPDRRDRDDAASPAKRDEASPGPASLAGEPLPRPEAAGEASTAFAHRPIDSSTEELAEEAPTSSTGAEAAPAESPQPGPQAAPVPTLPAGAGAILLEADAGASAESGAEEAAPANDGLSAGRQIASVISPPHAAEAVAASTADGDGSAGSRIPDPVSSGPSVSIATAEAVSANPTIQAFPVGRIGLAALREAGNAPPTPTGASASEPAGPAAAAKAQASAASGETAFLPEQAPLPEQALRGQSTLTADAKLATDAPPEGPTPEFTLPVSTPSGTSPGPYVAASVPDQARAAMPLVQNVPLGAVPVEIGLKTLAGVNRFEIRLDPPELGRVEVRIEIDGDAVKAQLVVDRVETLALLQRDAKTLERAFEQAGLKTSENGIDLALRDHQAEGRGQRGEERASRADSRAERTDDKSGRDETLLSSEPRRTIWRASGGVDLRI